MANRSREADKQLSELLKELDGVFRAKVATFLSMKVLRDSTISNDDLHQAAVCGAIEAFDKFDASMNVPIKAYLTMNAYYAIMREFFSAIRIPRSLIKKMATYAQSKTLLESIFERPVTKSELAEFLSITEQELSDSMMEIMSVAHVHLYDQDDFEPVDEVEDVEQVVNLTETIDLVRDAVSELTGDEQSLVYSLFYMDEPLAAAGKAVGIRKQSVAERRNRIFTKLRRKLNGVPI